MNPARAEYIFEAASRPHDCPSRQRSPSETTTMMTGSVRGKCSAPQAPHFRTWPPRPMAVGCPQTEQKPCRLCQPTCARACAMTPASSRETTPAAARASSNRNALYAPSSPPSVETSAAKWATPSRRPSSTTSGLPPRRSSSAGLSHANAGGPSPWTATLRSVEGQDLAGGIDRPRRDPRLVAPLALTAHQRIARIDVLARHRSLSRAAAFMRRLL